MQNDGTEEADSSETLVFVCSTMRCHAKYDTILTVHQNLTGVRSLHDLGMKRAGKWMLRHDPNMTRTFAVCCNMHGCNVSHFSNAKQLLCLKAQGSNDRDSGS
jgi:hypothetical protein